jgi:hypothetical protein
MKKDLVDVQLHTEEYYIQQYEEYSPEDIYLICKSLIKKAKAAGLTNCYLSFNSNREPYEDYLGLPSITPCGYRKKTKQEIKDEEVQKLVEVYAKKHGITFYEANALYQIRDKLGLEF